MSEVAALPTASVAGEEARLPVAMVRMARRLGTAIEALGGNDEFARFLAQLDQDPGMHDGDGCCLPLPTGAAQPVDRLVSKLGPSPLEIDLMVLAAVPHHHEATASIVRSLNPDGMPWPTVGLAAALAELGLLAGGGRAAVHAVLDGGALARAGVLTLAGDGPHPDRGLRLAPLVYEALAGVDGWPAGAGPDGRPAPANGLGTWLQDPAVVAATAAVARLAPVAITATSGRPDALAPRLAALVRAAGQEPAVLSLSSGIQAPALHGVLLLCLARGLVPVLWSRSPLGDVIAGNSLPLPVLLAVPQGELVTWPRPNLQLPTAPLRPADRLEAIGALLPELPGLEHPVGPATLEPAQLALVAHDLRTRSRLGKQPITRSDFVAAVDAQAIAAVPAGSYLVHPSGTWADLVLPEDRKAQLREAAARIEHRETVFDEWGFLNNRAGRMGLRLLFCGPPGTGKTLAAEVLAGEIGRDLLVVDLAQMVSKWIGETEKNLAAAFEAAERGGAVLLFDEADALFGKRTEVGDSRDRYANLETAYLLSRLERFEGVVVLATNLRQNLDGAFARRIEFIVPFDLPDAAEREQLWRRHLPPAAPLATSVDCARLAALYDLPGALIRNAAVAAAFLATSDNHGGDPAISLRHLVHAVKREYVKAGRAFPGLPTGLTL